MTETQKKYNMPLLVGAGVTLSVMLMVLGYLINVNLQRQVTPTFQNEIAKIAILAFLGLSSGYYIAISLKKNESKAYYFFAGILVPILIFAIFSSLTNADWLPTFLMLLGLVFPIFYLHSGILQDQERFEEFINIFAKIIPNIALFTIALSDYAFPLFKVYLNFDFGYTANFFIALIISIIAIFYLTEKKDKRGHETFFRPAGPAV